MPKEDTSYDYYEIGFDTPSNQPGGASTAISRTNAGRFFADALASATEFAQTATNNLAGNLYFLVGNPFPCMAEFSELLLDGRTFYLTHGHHASPDNLPPLPEGSVFLFGHTHVKLDETRNGIRCLNPGSVSIPKDGSHSCLVYENGVFSVKILED